MLTDPSLRELLGAGYRVSDADFVAHPQEHMSRTVYFMAEFLAERQNRSISSRELQRRIDDHLRTSALGPTRFNPVDWFSALWTLAEKGDMNPHFDGRCRELFDREGKDPYSYRIKSDLYDRVVGILSELDPPDPRIPGLAKQLDEEGAFDPISLEDARVWALRAMIVREGQPQFRATVLKAYGNRCAITECDATQALEAAHVKPYDGVTTNVVSNGTLFRADIHTLFDLDLIGVDPGNRLVHISNKLGNTVYQEFEGKPLREPNDPSATASRSALEWRWERFLGPG